MLNARLFCGQIQSTLTKTKTTNKEIPDANQRKDGDPEKFLGVFVWAFTALILPEICAQFHDEWRNNLGIRTYKPIQQSLQLEIAQVGDHLPDFFFIHQPFPGWHQGIKGLD